MSSSELEAQLKPLADWLGRYVNAHRFLWLMSLVCFLIAWNRGIALLYGLLALMLSLILLSWIMPWWALRRVSVERRQQGMAVAGQQLRLRYQFRTRTPLFFIRIGEQIPGHDPQQSETAAHFLARVTADDDIVLACSCPRRGVFTLPAPQVSCAWPFGFVERRLPVPAEEVCIEVVPKSFRIRHLPSPATHNPLVMGADSYLNRSSHSEFAGVRPYREGDSLKHVHWSASARQQQLVVREFHSFDTPSWLVVVDGQAGSKLGEGADSTFEYALQIAASMLEYARHQQLKLTLVVGSRKPLALMQEAGARDSSDALTALAAVQDDGEQSYQQLLDNTLAAMPDSPVVMTIRHDRQRINLPRAAGHLDVVFAADSFGQPLKKYAEGWQPVAEGVLRLDLHRLSKLHQVFAS